MVTKQTMRNHMKERLGDQKNLSMSPVPPECLNIEVNNTCNQRCVFCPYHGKYKPKEIHRSVLDIGFVKKIMDQAAELGIGRKEIGFYLAGEALLYKGLAELVSYAKQLGFPYVFLTTNGVLATPERINPIIDAGLDSIRFSVNAADRNLYAELHGSDDFDIVLENIKKMTEYVNNTNNHIATSLSCVLTKKTNNIEKKMKKTFGSYFDDIMFIPVMLDRLSNIDEVKEEYEVIDDDEIVFDKDFVCPLLFNTMYINALGRVVPCCNSYDNDTFFADLNMNPNLLDAWNSDGYRRFRGFFLRGESDKGTICENCMLRKKTVKRFMLDD